MDFWPMGTNPNQKETKRERKARRKEEGREEKGRSQANLPTQPIPAQLQPAPTSAPATAPAPASAPASQPRWRRIGREWGTRKFFALQRGKLRAAEPQPKRNEKRKESEEKREGERGERRKPGQSADTAHPSPATTSPSQTQPTTTSPTKVTHKSDPHERPTTGHQTLHAQEKVTHECGSLLFQTKAIGKKHARGCGGKGRDGEGGEGEGKGKEEGGRAGYGATLLQARYAREGEGGAKS